MNGSDGNVNVVEVEFLKCVEENVLGNILFVLDSFVYKSEDKGKNLDVLFDDLYENVVFFERKFEDFIERDRDEDDNFGGLSIRGFELFFRFLVRKIE